ncbi:MAG TPA: tetratricopeptide repeat protein [Bacteroidia bacterium]|nr:tetratricopeptide repeat protein [Bacteroidia bacterium]
MASFSSRQWIAVSAGTVLFISLFFINRKAPAKAADSSQPSAHAGKGVSFEQILADAMMQVSGNQRNDIKKLDDKLAAVSGSDQPPIIKSIINIYDSLGDELPATYYMEKLAAVQSDARLWYHAGDRYYRLIQVVKPDAHDAVLQRALDCFNKSLVIDSTNADARVGAGQCMVQQGQNPMQGIMRIESVLKKDSNNEKAQIALGAFSVQSAQYPKAIYRFNRVLKIDPSYIEAYLYLAETYEGMGNKKEAVFNLEKYCTFVKDTAIKSQVSSYIQKLKGDTIQKN